MPAAAWMPPMRAASGHSPSASACTWAMSSTATSARRRASNSRSSGRRRTRRRASRRSAKRSACRSSCPRRWRGTCRAAGRSAGTACGGSARRSSSSPWNDRRESAPIGVNCRGMRSMAIPSTAADGPADQQTPQQPTSLVELLADWYWEQDAEFRFTVVSSRRAGNNAADPFPYVGRKHWEQPALNLSEADWERHRAQLAWHQPFRDLEVQYATEDGRSVWVSLSGQPVFDEAGVFNGYRGIGRDVSAQKRAEEMHQLEHALARALAEATSTSEGVRGALRIICEREGWDAGRCFRVDEASGEMRYADGWFAREGEIEQLLRGSRVHWEAGKPVWSTDLHRSGAAALRSAGKGGRFGTFALPVVLQGRTIALLTFSAHTTREPDQRFVEAAGTIGSLFGQFLQRKDAEESLRESEARFRSLTQLALARERIASLAYSDPLTGLANRVSLAPALEQAIERARRHGHKLAGVFIDLDGFKQINDRHGHAAGDAFLVEVAQRLRRQVRASDLVARLGGDEFFVMLEGVQDMVGVERVVVKIIDALRRPYPGIGEAQRRVSATLGVSIFPDDAPDATTLIEHADEAMYTAKQAGKNAYCLYSTGHKPPAGAPAAPSTAPQP